MGVQVMKKRTIPTSLRGFGCIYRPTYKDRHRERRFSNVWWAKYPTDSGEVRRSLKTTDQKQAYEQLVTIAGQRISGAIRDARAETVTCSELLDLLVEHYRTKKTYIDVDYRVRRRLRPEFGCATCAERTSMLSCGSWKRTSSNHRL
jgi:hypothetical protein